MAALLPWDPDWKPQLPPGVPPDPIGNIKRTVVVAVLIIVAALLVEKPLLKD